MKKFIVFCIVLLSLIITANADVGDYIIKYRDNVDFVRTYSDSADEMDLGCDMYLVSEEKALELQEEGYLEFCEPDTEMTYYDTETTDPYLRVQWNLPLINASYPWSLNYNGDDIIVGIIDSGLALNHPDIDYTRVVEGYNFGARTSDSNYATLRFNTTDTSGHGTYCAGVIAAKRNNGIGMAGIADKVKILPLKVENSSGGIYTSYVINAINAAPKIGCDVLNISLGSGSYNSAMDAAVTNAVNKGIIVVCSAGNDTSSDPGDHVRYPAGYKDSISVASTTRNNTRATSSVVNESIFIAAPADGIVSTTISGSYSSVGGTSFAGPQVAAAAAIAKQIYPAITPAQFKDALQYSAKDLNPTVEGRDQEFGYGLLDLFNMTRYVEALKNKQVYVASFDQRPKNIRIRNLSESDANVTSIFTAYNNGSLCYSDDVPLTLTSGESYTHKLSVTEDHTRIAHFMWDSVGSASPVDWYIPQKLTKSTSSN